MTGARTTLVSALALAIAVALTVVPAAAQAQACTLLEVKSSKEAKLRVYFTKFAKEDQTNGRYKKCKIVKTASPDTQTFFITPFRQDANVVVLRTNWP